MFNTSIKVNFYDTDPGGVIFFANLLRFAHTGYEELLKSFGMYEKYFLDGELIIPIIHAESNYHKPIRAGDSLELSIGVSRLEKSSFELSYFFRNINDKISATAKTVHVMVMKNKFEKTVLPHDLKLRLEKLKIKQS